MRVNIAIGEVNGIKDAAFITPLSTSFIMENTVIIKDAIIKKVTGITKVLMSSKRLAKDASAPYRNEYSKYPSTKNRTVYKSMESGIAKILSTIVLPAQ